LQGGEDGSDPLTRGVPHQVHRHEPGRLVEDHVGPSALPLRSASRASAKPSPRVGVRRSTPT